jgi:hypothetical protein
MRSRRLRKDSAKFDHIDGNFEDIGTQISFVCSSASIKDAAPAGQITLSRM